MTTEERISKLEKELEDIRFERDVVHTESLRKRVLQGIMEAGIKDSTLTDINTTTTVGSTPSDVAHASVYDFRLRVVIDGTPYYIGLYST